MLSLLCTSVYVRSSEYTTATVNAGHLSTVSDRRQTRRQTVCRFATSRVQIVRYTPKMLKESIANRPRETRRNRSDCHRMRRLAALGGHPEFCMEDLLQRWLLRNVPRNKHFSSNMIRSIRRHLYISMIVYLLDYYSRTDTLNNEVCSSI
jgi:hypothetical protein